MVGLGSGRTVTQFVRALGRWRKTKGAKVQVVPSSLQIQLVAEAVKLPLIAFSEAKDVELVVDGADQIDSRRRLLKGGGGALLREKILYTRAKRRVILADATKFARWLTRPVPIELPSLARHAVEGEVRKRATSVTLRTSEKGYPFVTENGNLILDAYFGGIKHPLKLERELKGLPGVVEVGLFPVPPDVILRGEPDGRVRRL